MSRGAWIRFGFSETVSLRDLPETVLDLAGLEVDSPFPGASLVAILAVTLASRTRGSDGLRSADDPVPSTTPSARGTMYSVIADPYHYILNGDGIEELFNYRADPLEQRNLAGSPDASESAAAAAQQSSQTRQLTPGTQDVPPGRHHNYVAAATREQLRLGRGDAVRIPSLQ